MILYIFGRPQSRRDREFDPLFMLGVLVSLLLLIGPVSVTPLVISHALLSHGEGPRLLPSVE